jgi:hypothetical protein
MELATATVVGYLAKKLKDHKSVQDFFSDFTEGTVSWIKPLFIKEDGTEEKIIQKLKENTESIPKQDAVKAAIASEIEDNPDFAKQLEAMAAQIQKKTSGVSNEGNTLTVSGNNNIGVMQNVTGSTITITGYTPKP